MIEVKHICKSFGDSPVLQDINLNLQEGKIYGLLGRNGAGKSTLLNLITNRLFPDSGEIFIDGKRARENDYAQEKVYFMSEKTLYPRELRVRQVFEWSRRFYGGFDLPFAQRLSTLFGLDVNKKVSQLSTGYSSIYKLITAFCVPVPYVFLDEPVLGLDATHRDLFYKVLTETYVERPRTILISTHLIEEIATLLEHVVILHNGTVSRDQSCEELLNSGYMVTGKAGDIDAFAEGKDVIGYDSMGGLKTAYIIGKCPQGVEQLFETAPLTLQKLFVQLTSK